MELDYLDLFREASSWTVSKVVGASKSLDAATPCDRWDVRTLMNHMLETEAYFVSSARGQEASPPGPTPPEIVGDDPVATFETARTGVLDTFGQPGVVEKSGPMLGIAFADQLLHGWDLAKATGQDATMPSGLAQAAYDTIHGQFSADERKGVFDPELDVPPDAPAQDRLLAYTGRDPSL